MILQMGANIRQYYPMFYTFYESYFSRPNDVGDMDSWPATLHDPI